MNTSNLIICSMDCMVLKISNSQSKQCNPSKASYQMTSTIIVSIQNQTVMIHPIYSSIYSYSSIAY